MENPDLNPLLVSTLLKAYPPAAGTQDKEGFLPLHRLVRTCPSSSLSLSLSPPSSSQNPQQSPCLVILEDLLSVFPSSPLVSARSGDLPLHLLLDQPNPSPDTHLIHALLSAGPEAALRPGKESMLPIHVLLLNPHISPSDRLGCARTLLSLDPQALSLQHRLPSQQLALHLACDSDDPDLDVVRLLCSRFTDSVFKKDLDGYLPLHVALDRPLPSLPLVNFLLDRFPDAAFEQTSEGWTPLHFLVGCAQNPSVELVRRLSTLHPSSVQSLARTQDSEASFSFSPLSRAIHRRLQAVVSVLREALSRGGGGGGGGGGRDSEGMTAILHPSHHMAQIVSPSDLRDLLVQPPDPSQSSSISGALLLPVRLASLSSDTLSDPPRGTPSNHNPSPVPPPTSLPVPSRPAPPSYTTLLVSSKATTTSPSLPLSTLSRPSPLSVFSSSSSQREGPPYLPSPRSKDRERERLRSRGGGAGSVEDV